MVTGREIDSEPVHDTQFACGNEEKNPLRFIRKLTNSQHLYMVPNDKPFECLICFKTFNQRTKMKEHLTSVHVVGNKPFKCDVCEKTFSLKTCLNNHVNNEACTFECGVCKKTFRFKRNLSRHFAVVHRKERLFECPKCPMTFSYKQMLERHMTAVPHVGQKHNCRICKKTFYQKTNLKVHVINSHPNYYTQDEIEIREDGNEIHSVIEIKDNLEKIIHSEQQNYLLDNPPKTDDVHEGPRDKIIIHDSKKSYECHICRRPFQFKRNVLRHITAVHKKLRPFECPKCLQTFSLKQGLQRHLDKLYGCGKIKIDQHSMKENMDILQGSEIHSEFKIKDAWEKIIQSEQQSQALDNQPKTDGVHERPKGKINFFYTLHKKQPL